MKNKKLRHRLLIRLMVASFFSFKKSFIIADILQVHTEKSERESYNIPITEM